MSDFLVIGSGIAGLSFAIKAAGFGTVVEKRGTNNTLVWAAGEGWHPGVVGIVASRIKEITNKPTVIIGLDEDLGKGSGRSVSGIDLGSSIASLQRENLIIKGGGHKMAAGLSLERKNLDTAMSRLNELLTKQDSEKIQSKELPLDGALSISAITIDLLEQLEVLVLNLINQLLPHVVLA